MYISIQGHMPLKAMSLYSLEMYKTWLSVRLSGEKIASTSYKFVHSCLNEQFIVVRFQSVTTAEG